MVAFADCTAALPAGVLAAADVAMYDAKASGGDDWALYAEPRVRAAARAVAVAPHPPAVAVT